MVDYLVTVDIGPLLTIACIFSLATGVSIGYIIGKIRES